MTYRILLGGSIEELEKEVNLYLSKGYQLQGEICATEYPWNGRDDSRTFYTQAVILDLPTRPKA